MYLLLYNNESTVCFLTIKEYYGRLKEAESHTGVTSLLLETFLYFLLWGNSGAKMFFPIQNLWVLAFAPHFTPIIYFNAAVITAASRLTTLATAMNLFLCFFLHSIFIKGILQLLWQQEVVVTWYISTLYENASTWTFLQRLSSMSPSTCT